MDRFLDIFLKENKFENIEFNIRGGFLVPNIKDLNKEVVIELKKEFFVPLEAVEYDETFHCFMKSFVDDEVYNEFLDFAFSDLKRIYELFEEYSNLEEKFRNKLITLGVNLEYKSQFYKKSFIKKRILEQKCVTYDGKKYLIFFDFFDEDFEVKNGKFVFRKKMNTQFLNHYKKYRDGVDLFNSHFKVFNYYNAFSIKGIQINDILIGRRKTKKINILENNFIKRILVGSSDEYKVYESYDDKEFLSKVISHNLTFLINLLKEMEKIKNKQIYKYLSEIVYTQMLLIANNKCKNIKG